MESLGRYTSKDIFVLTCHIAHIMNFMKGEGRSCMRSILWYAPLRLVHEINFVVCTTETRPSFQLPFTLQLLP
jgi:hypothetical protein